MAVKYELVGTTIKASYVNLSVLDGQIYATCAECSSPCSYLHTKDNHYETTGCCYDNEEQAADARRVKAPFLCSVMTFVIQGKVELEFSSQVFERMQIVSKGALWIKSNSTLKIKHLVMIGLGNVFLSPTKKKVLPSIVVDTASINLRSVGIHDLRVRCFASINTERSFNVKLAVTKLQKNTVVNYTGKFKRTVSPNNPRTTVVCNMPDATHQLFNTHTSRYPAGDRRRRRKTIYKVQKAEKEDVACLICRVNKVDVVLACGHACACSSCVRVWAATRKNCPLCRGTLLPLKPVNISGITPPMKA